MLLLVAGSLSPGLVACRHLPAVPADHAERLRIYAECDALAGKPGTDMPDRCMAIFYAVRDMRANVANRLMVQYRSHWGGPPDSSGDDICARADADLALVESWGGRMADEHGNQLPSTVDLSPDRERCGERVPGDPPAAGEQSEPGEIHNPLPAAAHGAALIRCGRWDGFLRMQAALEKAKDMLCPREMTNEDGSDVLETLLPRSASRVDGAAFVAFVDRYAASDQPKSGYDSFTDRLQHVAHQMKGDCAALDSLALDTELGKQLRLLVLARSGCDSAIAAIAMSMQAEDPNARIGACLLLREVPPKAVDEKIAAERARLAFYDEQSETRIDPPSGPPRIDVPDNPIGAIGILPVAILAHLLRSRGGSYEAFPVRQACREETAAPFPRRIAPDDRIDIGEVTRSPNGTITIHADFLGDSARMALVSVDARGVPDGVYCAVSDLFVFNPSPAVPCRRPPTLTMWTVRPGADESRAKEETILASGHAKIRIESRLSKAPARLRMVTFGPSGPPGGWSRIFAPPPVSTSHRPSQDRVP